MVTEVISSIGTGKDYTTLASWWTAKGNRDLVTNDEIQIAEIYGVIGGEGFLSWNETGAVDSTHYYVVRASAGQRFKGNFGNLLGQAGISKAFTGSYPYILSINADYTRIENIYLRATGTTNTAEVSGIFIKEGVTGFIIDGVGITDIKTKGSNIQTIYGIKAKNATGIIKNCFINNLNVETTGNNKVTNCYGVWGSSNVKLYNSTIINLFSKSTSDTRSYAIGCLDSVCTNNSIFLLDAQFENTAIVRPQGRVSSGYNATDLSTIAGTNGITGLTASDELTNVTIASANCKLKSTSSLIDKGTSLSSIFTDDIAGNTRGTLWDIGAWEYTVFAGLKWNGVTISKFNGVKVGKINSAS